ncbi:MAG: alpha/beta hydrolase [Cyanobacteria bacterium P01_D01_bin.36]
MFAPWQLFLQLPFLTMTTLYQAIACHKENKLAPPGRLIDVGGHHLHLMHVPPIYPADEAKPTVVIDHSLGGVEGYLLVRELSRVAEVCLCDRAGYGWSDISKRAATSEQSVIDLDVALTKADVKPPYILVGNSLGSYNMRLYAHRFPKKVAGMVLTDGLHEKALLNMPPQLRLLQFLFFSGFAVSILGSALGFVRVAANIGIFECIKPSLRHLPTHDLRPVIRSFYRPKHWFTMAREIAQLSDSGRQLRVANELGALPIVNIRAKSFFKPSWFSRWLPTKGIERVRSQMHTDLMKLSTRTTQLPAHQSSHFVWIDQPEVIVQAVELLLLRVTVEPIQRR